MIPYIVYNNIYLKSNRFLASHHPRSLSSDGVEIYTVLSEDGGQLNSRINTKLKGPLQVEPFKITYK